MEKSVNRIALEMLARELGMTDEKDIENYVRVMTYMMISV